MNLLTRRGASITVQDLPPRARVLSGEELKKISGGAWALSGPCDDDCDCLRTCNQDTKRCR